MTHQTEATKRRVRLWFGSKVICSHAAAPDEAERYARLMARRFAGLTVTIDDQPGEDERGLPHKLLWEQAGPMTWRVWAFVCLVALGFAVGTIIGAPAR